ncbi:HD domain-containing protein [Candidatus Dojkabacteria bacterium]|nr:HD domain-containing protein [Candidatus Dojkabacteria bacterium]
MKRQYKNLWDIVKNKLNGIGKKDYVLHSKMVTRAMEEIIEGEGGNPDILIPAAMLHDIGWINVPRKFQFAKTHKDKIEAEKQHLEKAVPLIKKILQELQYSKSKIYQIIHVVTNHKSKKPGGDKNIECMVDADNLSDTYKESFYSDAVAYNVTPQEALEFRSKNSFFTETANQIFRNQLQIRKEEIENGKAFKIMDDLKK